MVLEMLTFQKYIRWKKEDRPRARSSDGVNLRKNEATLSSKRRI